MSNICICAMLHVQCIDVHSMRPHGEPRPKLAHRPRPKHLSAKLRDSNALCGRSASASRLTTLAALCNYPPTPTARGTLTHLPTLTPTLLKRPPQWRSTPTSKVRLSPPSPPPPPSLFPANLPPFRKSLRPHPRRPHHGRHPRILRRQHEPRPLLRRRAHHPAARRRPGRRRAVRGSQSRAVHHTGGQRGGLREGGRGGGWEH